MMKKTILLLATVLLSINLQSCLNNGDDPEITQTVAFVGYNHLTDLNDNSVALKASRYTIFLDITAQKADVTIESSYTPEGDPFIIKMAGLDLKTADNAYTISATDVTPEVTEGNPADYIVRNLDIKITPRYTTDENGQTVDASILEATYRLADNYSAFYCDTKPHFIDCETTTGTLGSEAYTSTSTTYDVTLNNSKSATVVINNAQFDRNMPKMTITLRDIPVALTRSGYQLNTESIVPEINDIPLENYTMTDVSFEVYKNATAMSLRFKCNTQGAQYSTNASGSVYPDTENE